MINENVKIALAVPVLRSNVVMHDQGWSAYTYVVVDRAAAESAVGFAHIDRPDGDDERYSNADFAATLTGWHAFSSGPGRRFSEVPHVKVFGKKLLVTCHHGWDV